MTEAIIFYVFGGLTLFAALGVLLHPNPVLSALHLVATMVGVAGLFFNLNAPFIGAVQIMVYAGAVMVLFLFVVMIFDTKQDRGGIMSYGQVSTFIKQLCLFAFWTFFVGAILLRIKSYNYIQPDPAAPHYEVRNLAKVMFTDYMFVFEVLGLLLLVVPIGTVALSRIRGGTHDE